MAIVFVRTLLGTAVLVAIALVRGHSLRVPRSNYLSLFLAGALGVFLHQLLQAHALTLTTAVRTGWLISVIPIWSTILALLFLGERLWLLKCGGLAIGFCGVLLLITGGNLDGLLLPRTTGDLLILSSTINWAIYPVLGRRVVERVNPIVATTLIFCVGLALLLPSAHAADVWPEYDGLSALGMAAILFLGIGCSGIAYLLWCEALKRASTSSVASLLYLEPLVTLSGAIVLLSEEVTVATLCGGLLVLVGVYFVQRPKPVI